MTRWISTRVLARLAMAALLAATGLASLRAMPASATTWSVTLSTDVTTQSVGSNVRFTATANQPVDGTGMFIVVYDTQSNGAIGWCTGGSQCVVWHPEYYAQTRNYIAYVGNGGPSTAVATSSAVNVTWTGTWSWTISLSATPTNLVTNQGTNLAAASNGNVSHTPYAIEIDDQTTGTVVKTCPDGYGCWDFVAQSAAGVHTYIAHITSSSGNLATSNTVTVTWTAAPSDACDNPAVTVFDGYLDGAYARLRVQPVSLTETLVCYRIDSGSEQAAGNYTIDTAASAGVPSVDGAAGACAQSGNQAPGPHPAVNGAVDGQPVYLDDWQDSSQTWVCMTLGSLQARVIVPTAGATTPSVVQNVDTYGQPRPAPPAGPAGAPSSTCVSSGRSAANQVLAATVMNQQAWLSTWQATPLQRDICARISGAATAGVLVTVPVPDTSTLPPTVTPSSGTDACSGSTPLVSFTSPLVLFLGTTAPSSNPLSVCVGVAMVAETVTAGYTVGTAPVPTVSIDPDTL